MIGLVHVHQSLFSTILAQHAYFLASSISCNTAKFPTCFRNCRICEICGSIAQNVVVGMNESDSTEHRDETNESAAATVATNARLIESRNFWQGHRFLNFLLACMVFAFVVSWLFHFKVPL